MHRNRHRLLIAEDDPAVTEDFMSAFGADGPEEGTDRAILEKMESGLFGSRPFEPRTGTFDLTLCRQGQRAVAAHAEALDAGEPFDLALIDMRMPPGMNGFETAALLRGADTQIQIGIVTGYSDLDFRQIAKRIPTGAGLFFVRKPFIGSELRDCVAARLGVPVSRPRWHDWQTPATMQKVRGAQRNEP